MLEINPIIAKIIASYFIVGSHARQRVYYNSKLFLNSSS